MRSIESLRELINRRRRQFLVHCYLYYELGVSIIDDATFDSIAKELYELQKKYPDVAAAMEYDNICSGLDDSLSGYYIKYYPPEIKSRAVSLLAYTQRKSFDEICQTYGIPIAGEKGGNNNASRKTKRTSTRNRKQ